jgi:hypothetical protein
VALLAAPTLAHAESAFGESTTDTPEKAIVTDESESSGDGVYGRIAGDLSISAAAGIEVDFTSPASRLLLGASVRYFSAVGPYFVLREGFDEDDDYERLLGAGVLVEPLFLYRAVKNLERGPQFWDLTLDSISLSVGAFWAEPMGGSLGNERGIECGLGVGVPLIGEAAGPWLRTRGVARVDEAGHGAGALWITLEWQAFLDLGLNSGPELHE